MYKLNFNHIFYFMTIANEGSIVKAAKKLNLTQPALSHQLKQLELDLGDPLFDRKGKRLVLNDKGKKLRVYASKIFRTSEELLHAMASDSKQIFKSIKVGVLPWVSKRHLNKIMSPLYSAENVQLKFVQNSLDHMLNELAANRLDLLVSDVNFKGRYKNLVVKRLALEEKIVCVASQKKKINQKFPECLNGLEYIGYSDEAYIAEWTERFVKSNNLNLYKKAEFDDSYQLLLAIKESTGISFVFEELARPYIKAGELQTLGRLKQDSFPLYLISSKEKRKDPYINKLWAKSN